ncbi:MAG: redoxin family protein [Sedimentisphaerales bacterium]
MRNVRLLSMAATLILILTATGFGEQRRTPLDINTTAPNFNLPGIDGKDYQLSSFADANILVIIFTADHCPTAQAYETRIIQLTSDYKDKGVTVVAVSSNDPLAVRLDELAWTDLGDSFEEMKLRAAERHFNFPYLYDGETQSMANAYGPVSTPHVFIFDKERKLRYTGPIDNNEDPNKVKKNFVRDALDSLLAGQEIAAAKVKTFGCSIKWADKRKSVEKALADWAKEPVDVNFIDVNGIKELMKNDTKKLLLINVWATWCGPCVIEMPELVTISRMYSGRAFRMVTISGDNPDKLYDVLKFLQNKQVSCKNYLFSGQDRPAMGEAVDKEWQGAIPYTVIIKPGGEIIYRHSGPIEPLEVKKVIIGYLGRYFF